MPNRPYYCLATPGACGTSALNAFLYGECGVQKVLGLNVHRRDVPGFACNKQFVYMYSDPRNALLSFISRSMLVEHGKNMGVDIEQEMSLREYLVGGKDYLDLAGHFKSWFNSPPNINIMFVKYEELPQHLPAMMERWRMDPDLAKGFKWEPRKSDWRLEDHQDRALLNVMFEEHLDLISGLEGCFTC